MRLCDGDRAGCRPLHGRLVDLTLTAISYRSQRTAFRCRPKVTVASSGYGERRRSLD
jgi:hypothetical protein